VGLSAGDFEDFAATAGDRLWRMAYAMTSDRLAAEDLVQDVLARMYLRRGSIDDPLAYARRSLANAATSRWRLMVRHREEPLTAQHELPASDESRRSDEHDRVVRAISTLPRQQRAVVVLRYLEDLSERQTAEILGCTVGTVKSQCARALDRLAVLLAEQTPDATMKGST
jgi:RNA polymerase sigma-70 factor (sigma-E family)